MPPKEHTGGRGPSSRVTESASPALSTSSVTSKKRKSSPQPKFYGVKTGQVPGVYLSWKECERNITGFKNASFKSFFTREEAEAYVSGRELSIRSTPSSVQPEKFYGVACGRIPGVYTDWDAAQEQIKGWKGPKYKKFLTRREAEEFVKTGGGIKAKPALSLGGSKKGSQTGPATVDDISDDELLELHDAKRARRTDKPAKKLDVEDFEMEDDELVSIIPTKQMNSTQAGPIRIYTDGSSLGNGKNGARAGLGVYFGAGDPRNLAERLPGETQTNQRAELAAILRALQTSPTNREVHIMTDSKYSIDCVTVWYKTWERNQWQTSMKKPVLNKDLVQDVLTKINEREALGTATRFYWVKGHANEPGNEAADHLAVLGAKQSIVE